MIKDLTYRYHSCFCVLLETHVSGRKAENIIKNLGFDDWCVSEAEGFSGGIWCLWMKDKWTIKPIIVHKQFIHLEVQWDKDQRWMFTAVYGSPQVGRRRELWKGLEDIAGTIEGPWCLGGDFNSVLTLNDTGSTFNLSQDSNIFLNCINRFLEVGVRHLPKLKSDHLPILLDFQMAEHDRGPKPFRFLALWVLHNDYKNMVERSWNNRNNLLQNIADVTNNMKIIARLEGISNKLSFSSNLFLEKLQKDLCKEYESIATQEEA
ncbi:uncharacterized protein [Arachis hypogaea]|uniref:uncharacterized protein n=1 Tax=Arachis hypogaea TaxID=3818 RepID=UPI0011056FF1|nr:uncharacterized protein LOC114925766 [Arachis hypogaea]